MSVPRRPRPRREPENTGTALALVALLFVAAALLGLGALVMPQVFGFPAVVFGFLCVSALHYVLWGWWLKAKPLDEEDDP